MSGSSQGGIFAGMRFLEFGSGAAGPVATRYFAEQGAEVIRIESARRPDFLRILWLTPDSPHGLDGSPMFILLNPDKRSLAVDMKTDEGRVLVRRLVDEWAIGRGHPANQRCGDAGAAEKRPGR